MVELFVDEWTDFVTIEQRLKRARGGSLVIRTGGRVGMWTWGINLKRSRRRSMYVGFTFPISKARANSTREFCMGMWRFVSFSAVFQKDFQVLCPRSELGTMLILGGPELAEMRDIKGQIRA